MSDLQNQTPASTYKGLLQVGDYTNGVDSTSKYVSDGEGTDSALSISESKVGVGTTSPSAELEVNGDIVATTLTTSGAVTGGSVSTSGAVTAGSVSTSGQVGAGSVDVSGNVVADEYALDGTGSSSSAVAIHAPDTNELAIRTSSTEQLRIDSDGRIGIGIAIPSMQLEVAQSNGSSGIRLNYIPSDYPNNYKSDIYHDGAGNLKIESWAGSATTAGDILLAPNNGNVGINTVSPSAPLEVSSTTGGVVLPRMNDDQRDAISSPTDGEMIFNNETNKLNVYNGTAWRELTDTAV